MSTVTTVQPIELVLQNSVHRIDIYVTDANGVPVDATALSLQVFDAGSNVILQDNFFTGYGSPPTPPTQILKPAGTTGQYYFPFGDTSFDAKNSTQNAGEFLFAWTITGATGTASKPAIQVVRVVPVSTFQWVPRLRARIDKAAKQIDDDPNDPCFLGYTDSMIIEYLQTGLEYINAFQPYPTFVGIDQFPGQYGAILLDAGFFAALLAQEVFAIDTDINYGDNGETFTIDHQPKLDAMMNSTWARMTQTIPGFKRQFVRSGALHLRVGPNFRLASLLNTAPTGTFLRNWFVGF